MLDKIKAVCHAAAKSDENIYAHPTDGFDVNIDYAARILDPNTSDLCVEKYLASRQRKIEALNLADVVPSNEKIMKKRKFILNKRDWYKLFPIFLPPFDRATGQEHHHVCFAARILGPGFEDHCPAGLTSMLDVEYNDACDSCPYFGIISVDSDGLHFFLNRNVVEVFEDGDGDTDA